MEKKEKKLPPLLPVVRGQRVTLTTVENGFKVGIYGSNPLQPDRHGYCIECKEFVFNTAEDLAAWINKTYKGVEFDV